MDTTSLAPATGNETAAAPAQPADIKPLPLWYFGFEAVASGAYDLYKAFPQILWVLGALAVVNLVVSLTVLRSRLQLAKRLWRGKSTRKIAIGLLALRLGSHFVLALLGMTVVSTAGHLAFAAVMAAITGPLLWFAQRTALRALAAEDARTAELAVREA
ncbi:hypothetical protein ACFY1P_22175 [Streptomyces sp. NPDC001407]|uniref:hypothetical protein n=1 Tax=unclassified Streptomyces TaxID=2593676 RepID=UPI0036A738EE